LEADRGCVKKYVKKMNRGRGEREEKRKKIEKRGSGRRKKCKEGRRRNDEK
jgi:hypothetical protein